MIAESGIHFAFAPVMLTDPSVARRAPAVAAEARIRRNISILRHTAVDKGKCRCGGRRMK